MTYCWLRWPAGSGYSALKTARDHSKPPLCVALQVAGVQRGHVPARLLDGQIYGYGVRIVADFVSNGFAERSSFCFLSFYATQKIR